MVLAVINILGQRFRLVLLPERDSLPPATFETSGVAVESQAPALPGVVKTKPVLALVKRREVA